MTGKVKNLKSVDQQTLSVSRKVKNLKSVDQHYFSEHWLSQTYFQDFHGPIVNTDHFLYWGRTRRTVDGKMVEFNIIEQTEFLDDVTYSPFNAR